MQYVLVRALLLSHNMVLRFAHVVPCISSWFLFIAVLYGTFLCDSISWCIHSALVDTWVLSSLGLLWTMLLGTF